MDFEKWLDRLPGKKDVSIILSPGPRDAGHLKINVERFGKNWRIFIPDSTPTQLRFLADAPLKTKIRAVHAFPLIVREIYEANRRLASELIAANEAYDTLSQEMNLKFATEGQ